MDESCEMKRGRKSNMRKCPPIGLMLNVISSAAPRHQHLGQILLICIQLCSQNKSKCYFSNIELWALDG